MVRNINKTDRIIDFHTHILPGIDDGASSIGQTLDMCRHLEKQGVERIVATPHFVYTETWQKNLSVINDTFLKIQKELELHNIKIMLYKGYEVFGSEDLSYMNDINRLTINGTRYILVEMPLYGAVPWLDELLYTVKSKNLIPIFAHPERCECFYSDIKLISRLVYDGAILQVNIGSITGLYGKLVRNTVRKFFKKDLVKVVGSDIHQPHALNMNIAKSLEQVREWSKDYNIEQLIWNNPIKLLNDEEI